MHQQIGKERFGFASGVQRLLDARGQRGSWMPSTLKKIPEKFPFPNKKSSILLPKFLTAFFLVIYRNFLTFPQSFRIRLQKFLTTFFSHLPKFSNFSPKFSNSCPKISDDLF